MKIIIDTNNKTLDVEGHVKVKELMEWLGKFENDLDGYTVKVHSSLKRNLTVRPSRTTSVS
jgi:hypothetical protein